MAISPTVQAYMQNQEQPVSSAEQMFSRNFGDQAFSTLRAKHPSLISFIVTFKVLDSQVETGSALGVFVIQCGKDVRYLPVVAVDGRIVSCEMAYDKGSDLFTPLSEKSVKDIIGANQGVTANILDKNMRVEDTRGLFKNLVRPPMSSNVIIASNFGVSELPNPAKEALSKYFTGNPELLAKIAEFYPIEVLAERLSSIQEKVAYEAPDILRIDKLTKEAALFLHREEKEELLREGFLVKKAVEGDMVFALPLDSLQESVETELNFVSWPLGTKLERPDTNCMSSPISSCEHTAIFKGFALRCTAEGFSSVPVLLSDNYAYTVDGHSICVTHDRPILVRDLEEVKSESDLVKFGFSSDTSFAALNKSAINKHGGLFAVPHRTGAYSLLKLSNGCGTQCTCIGDEIFILSCGNSRMRISNKIRYGFLKLDNEVVIPKESMWLSLPNYDDNKGIQGLVHSYDELRRLLAILGNKLVTVSDGATTSITDRKAEKTASFCTKADAAEWLHKTYNLSGPQIHTVLDNRNTLVFNKTAFVTPQSETQMMPSPTMMLSQQTVPGTQEMPAPAMMSPQQSPSFDPSMLGNYAALSDPELLDTGMLASFAQDPDIKTLLVDYLPDFIRTSDKLGRVILLFCLQKKDFEDFYSTEKYTETLVNCRKIFKTLGDLVSTLKSYVNMA